jgi:hypothetical protein
MARYCVFSGSKEGADPVIEAAVRSLGSLLAISGHTLIYGGARTGLMGRLATEVLEGGGKVVGVLPDFMRVRELAHPNLTELIPVRTMHERKTVMADHADGFIALPGGYGTLDELFEVLSWAQLRLHDKPVALLNVAGFFDALLAFLDEAQRTGFLKPEHRALLRVHTNPETLLSDLETFQSGPAITKWT